jgi:hypothetical protein
MLLYASAGGRLRRLFEMVKQYSSATNVIASQPYHCPHCTSPARWRWRLWLLAVPCERRRSDRCACGGRLTVAAAVRRLSSTFCSPSSIEDRSKLQRGTARCVRPYLVALSIRIGRRREKLAA